MNAETEEDFESLVLQHPNESAVWRKYLASCVRMGDIDKARSVAKRAVEGIHYREESGRLSVWAAWMSIENAFGTQEGLVKVFEQALQSNDPVKVYFHLAHIYAQSKKYEVSQCLVHYLCLLMQSCNCS